MKSADAALWLDDQPVSTGEVMAVLRKERKLPELVKSLILDRNLNQITLAAEFEEEIFAFNKNWRATKLSATFSRRITSRWHCSNRPSAFVVE